MKWTVFMGLFVTGSVLLAGCQNEPMRRVDVPSATEPTSYQPQAYPRPLPPAGYDPNLQPTGSPPLSPPGTPPPTPPPPSPPPASPGM